MDRLADPLLPGGQLKQATDFREAGRTTVGESHKPIGTIWAPGLEPGTLGLENRCSIQLSYAHIPIPKRLGADWA